MSQNKSIPTFSSGAPWADFETALKVINQAMPISEYNSIETILRILTQIQYHPDSSFFLVQKTTKSIQILIVQARDAREASSAPKAMFCEIDFQGRYNIFGTIDLPSAFGEQKQQSNAQTEKERDEARRKEEEDRRKAKEATEQQKNQKRLETLETLNDIITKLPSNLEASLALGSDGVINEEATQKFVQSSTKKREEAFLSTPSSNPMNSLGLTTNRPVVISNSTYITVGQKNPKEAAALKRYTSSGVYSYQKLRQTTDYFYKFQKNNSEKFLDLKTLYLDSSSNLDLAIDYISVVDREKQKFVDSLDDYEKYGLGSDGYLEGMSPTAATLQMIHDLGKYCFRGGWYFVQKRDSQKIRSFPAPKPARTKDAYNISKNLGQIPYVLSHQNIMLTSTEFQNKTITAAEASYKYSAAAKPYPQTETQRAMMMTEFAAYLVHMNNKTLDSPTCTSVEMAHRVWCEMLNSYVMTNGNPAAKSELELAKPDGQFLNKFTRDALDGSNGNLLNANQSVGITSLLRGKSKGKTIMPLEKPGLGFEEIGKNGDVVSGIDQWFDPNLGKVLEGEDPDFGGLDAWTEKFSVMVENIKGAVSPYMIDGHGQLVMNEIIRAFRDLSTDFSFDHQSADYYSLLNTDSNIDLDRNVEMNVSALAGSANGKSDRLEGPRAVMTALHILSKCHPLASYSNFIKLLDSTCNLWKHSETWLKDQSNSSWGNEPAFSSFVESIVDLKTSSQATETSNNASADQVYQMYLLITGLITSLIRKIELALSWNISIHCADSGLTAASGEESATAKKCFADIFGNTLPVEQGVSSPNDVSANTTYSGIPHVHIRGMILYIMCHMAKELTDNISISGAQKMTYGVAKSSYITTFNKANRVRQILSETFLTAVDNVDPDNGPVRWKLSYGAWPNKDIEVKLAGEIEASIIPTYVREIVTKQGSFSGFDFSDYAGDEASFRELYLSGNTLSSNNSSAAVSDSSGGSYGAVVASDAQVGMVAGLAGGSRVAMMGSLLTIKPVEDATANIFERYYSFLLTKENYVPITYITNKEIPKVDAITTTLESRGQLSWLYKWCTYHRESSRRMFTYLDSLVKSFESLKPLIEGLAASPGGNSFTEIAQIPGVHAPDIVRYSSPRQSILRKYIQQEESGMPYKGYIATENNTSMGALEGVITLVTDLTDKVSNSKEKGNPNEGRVVTLGLPSGLIDGNLSLNDVSRKKPLFKRLVKIEQYSKPLLAGIYADKISRYYWPSLFITNSNFCKLNITTNTTADQVIRDLSYIIIDPEDLSASTVGFNQVADQLKSIIAEAYIETDASVGENRPTAIEILTNHLHDFCLKNYMKVYSGIKITETSFPINSDTNELFIDQAIIDDYPVIFETLNIDPGVFLDKTKIKTFDEVSDSLEGSIRTKWNVYTSIYAALQSRLISSNDMISKTLSPNIFDRVFTFYTHLSELRFNPQSYQAINTYLKDNMEKIVVNEKFDFYKIIQGSAVEGNYIFNDNITSTFFAVKTL